MKNADRAFFLSLFRRYFAKIGWEERRIRLRGTRTSEKNGRNSGGGGEGSPRIQGKKVVTKRLLLNIYSGAKRAISIRRIPGTGNDQKVVQRVIVVFFPRSLISATKEGEEKEDVALRLRLRKEEREREKQTRNRSPQRISVEYLG